MGWYDRDWYLGEHRSQVFDTNGNGGTTAWWNGRIVGGWGQRVRDGAVAYRLLEPVGAAARRRIDELAEALTAWLEPTVVTPKFRTPLEKELAGS
jgi:hypothetical protein